MGRDEVKGLEVYLEQDQHMIPQFLGKYEKYSQCKVFDNIQVFGDFESSNLSYSSLQKSTNAM